MFKPIKFAGKVFKKYLLMPGHPGKIRVQNIIGKVLFSKGILVKNDQGVLFKLDANDWITRIILKEGDYESGSTMLAKKILKDGGFFLDVGANFGLFTCIGAYDNEKLKVISVEPNRKIISQLLDNIRINGLDDNVKLVNAAVSNQFQLVSLEQPASDNIGTSVTRIDHNAQLLIMSCPLEFICNHYGLTEIELLKIDIEGNEFDILENFSFNNYLVKNIILEFNHLSPISFKVLLSFFEIKGFKGYSVFGELLIDDKQGIPENNIWFVNYNR